MHGQFADPALNLQHLALRHGLQIADFGAGAGHYVFLAAKAVGPNGRVYAIDIQKDLLDRIKREAKERRLDTIEVIWGDLDEPGGSHLPKDSQDAVIMSNLLFQAEKRGAVLREAHHVLKHGGKLLVVDWKDSYGNLGPTSDQVLTEPAARKLCADSGFEITDTFDAGAHHYGFIAVKK